ncbi:ubiquitin-protein ligase-like protein [Macrophomina phaseolina]|uniref:Ubiquitin-protein ligase-like protein n=1 Tax=Macrophomina phaseolina TaxID=35725 RepID=A0ABQ8FVR2_9PEZI|nr:ubiquitin-protein ligase-like protein [Macrophomina phaseolina]
MNSGTVIAEATGSGAANLTNNITSAAGKFVQSSAAAVPGAAASAAAAATSGEAVEGADSLFNLDYIWNLGKIGGIFSYITSRWALATFTVAILLNRTQFYASSRIPLNFQWHVRLAVYLIPIVTLLYQTQCLLQAIRCQTSPEWSQLRYNDAKQPLAVDMAGEGGLLYKLSSKVLYWEDDMASCRAVNMGHSEGDFLSLNGSLARLWPLFLSLCLSQFTETMSCALQGRQPMPETGMTLFEHSLAFSETEAMLTKPFDLGSSTATVARTDGTTLKLTRGMLLQVLNVPPEVLVMAVVSSLSHLSSNILAVLGLRTRFRLVNTGVWGVAYMVVFIWTFLRMTGTIDAIPNDLGILRIPTVCLVGFIPHLLIMAGLTACALIYGLALLVTAFNLPAGAERNLTLKERFRTAYGNLQANVHFSGSTPISVSWADDFYTALLKIGFTVLTAASEAVFLNEGTPIRVSEMTWLEGKRIQEFAERRAMVQRTIDGIPAELREDFVADGVKAKDVPESATALRSGYARERKTRGQKSLPEARAAGRDNGVGLLQRRGRWVMTYEFARGIHRLVLAIQARLLLSIMRKLGITRRPRWLLTFAGINQRSVSLKETSVGRMAAELRSRELEFWYLTPEGKLTLPSDTNVDVEAETRKRLEQNGRTLFGEDLSEESLSSNLYSWWKNGGWWGDVDSSGDYTLPSDVSENDDTTSFMSMSTLTGEEAWSDVEEDGRRTPTQEDPHPDREVTPTLDDASIDPSQLARLLDPQTDEDRTEAQLLASHLRSNRIMTRAQYRKAVERDRSRLLASRYLSGHMHSTMTPEEEEQALERYILERRSATAPQRGSSTDDAGTWASGADGMGSGGPQCVVCQASPRTILVWPCGCLSLCDDCRVGLATRNFDSCVCCRSDVAAYSRLFVP